jgi:ubiquinone/menaquinone biosynthesis C-methylase UbiE
MTNVSKPHVCPWWLGYMLISPVRRFLENPEQILGPYVREGMTVLEIGPGMGYYSLPLARMVGRNGRVICVDVQEKMLQSLRRRASKAGLLDRITTVVASQDSLHLEAYQSSVDFVFVFAVVHEVPDQGRLFEEAHRAMKPEGLLLFSEPKGHVKPLGFEKSVELAKSKGFGVIKAVDIWRYHSVLLRKTV